MSQINLLIFGDVVGKLGRKALAKKLPELKARYSPHLTIANAENLAHGRGLTESTLNELVEAGVDAFTSGQHVWENQQGAPLLSDEQWSKHLIRPGNVDPLLPGNSAMTFVVLGKPVTIANLQGRLFMSQESSSPFLSFDRIWQELSSDQAKPMVIIDFHAEATSEKQAFGHYVDGRASLVYGTHTHVPTADAKILPQGTAYCTDIGMVGLTDSVIGFEKNSSIKRFLEETTAPYELLSSGQAEVNGLAISLDIDSNRVLSLEQIREFVDI
ncbi:MAG: TIGR00282 family metallophosphoesterase [Patescibacteria group bacterium]|nr:TIGR00282 family metallophosphoesterase [Patescibacteria group bacterium]